MKRLKFAACAIVSLAVVACKSEQGTVLQILASPAVEDDCTLSSTPTQFQGNGIYDPTGSDTYFMTLYMQNLANDEENPSAITGDSNIKASANDAQLIGYDTCYYRSDDPAVVAYNPDGEGLPIECDDVPGNQRLFVTGSGTVESGGGTLSTSIQLLDLASLRVFFGDAFDPAALAAAFNDDPYDSTLNPVNSVRNAAWGDFPNVTEVPFNIQVRARAKRQDGGTMRSNWFIFPMRVAPLEIHSACVSIPCATGRVGEQFADDSCVPYSGGPYTCEEVDDCS